MFSSLVLSTVTLPCYHQLSPSTELFSSHRNETLLLWIKYHPSLPLLPLEPPFCFLSLNDRYSKCFIELESDSVCFFFGGWLLSLSTPSSKVHPCCSVYSCCSVSCLLMPEWACFWSSNQGKWEEPSVQCLKQLAEERGRPQESSRHRSTPPSARITPLLAQDSWSSMGRQFRPCLLMEQTPPQAKGQSLLILPSHGGRTMPDMW